MRRTLLIWAGALFFFSSLFAQQTERPEGLHTFPSFVKLEVPVPFGQHTSLFENTFNLNSQDQLKSQLLWVDELGFTHEKFQQYYKNVIVDGATYTVHAQDGMIVTMSGDYMEVGNLNVNPSISASAAFQIALDQVGASQYMWDEVAPYEQQLDYEMPEGELVVAAVARGAGVSRLAYKFDIYAVKPLYRADVYIDAHTGEFIKANEKIHVADVSASGTSLYNGTVNFTADNYSGNNHRLRQSSDGNGIETYDMNNSTNYNNASDITSGSNFFGSGAATGVQAHWGAEQTHKYFLQDHGRNSFDGNGAVIRSYVSYSSNYVNAFWNGSVMTYGDGDGVSYGPLVSLDIVGHEITHGVTQYAANLVYSYESGALNESFSDIFGEAIEEYALSQTGGSNDWQMGTDIGIGGSGAIRSMNNPNAHGDPDTYGGTYWYTGSGDNGGVHINSGVQNKWFYILTVGESGTNDIGSSYSVTGIGMEKAAAIAYRNLAVYLGVNSQYADARTGAIQSAVDLYGSGSAEEIATTNAWYAVGVGSEYGAPASYCNSSGANSSYEWIANVTVGSFSNNSGAAGYTDFTGMTVNVDEGQSYSISLTPGFSGTTYQEYWKIWIDYNGDADFDDAGELAFDPGGMSSTTVNGTINIPGGTAGTTTRMRVSMKWNASQTSCENFSYGEVEDYTISIGGGGGPDTQPPSTPTGLSASNTTQTSTDLSWNASTDNVGVDGYRVYVDGNLDGTTTSTSYTVSGLSAGTTYSMSVEAYDAAGNTSGQASINVTTNNAPDTQPPSTPTGLSASNTTSSSTDLSWNASTDNVGVAGYRVYVDGNLDGTTASTSYSVSGLSASTTYSMAVEAYDAAGNTSGQASVNVTTDAGGGGPVTLSADYFETGWDGWADGGSDCFRYSGSRSYEGSYSIRIRDNSGVASSMTSSAYNLTSYSSIDVEFFFYPNSMENGEDFWLRFYDGSSWHTVGVWTRGVSFNNNSFYTSTVTINSSDYNFASNSQLRFQCDASGNADRIYIDAVTVTGNSGSFVNNPTGIVNTIQLSPATPNTNTISNIYVGNLEAEILVYPNPATNMLTIEADESIQSLQIFSINGALLYERLANEELVETMDISNLAAGTYFISVQTEEEVIHEKFVKH